MLEPMIGIQYYYLDVRFYGPIFFHFLIQIQIQIHLFAFFYLLLSIQI